MNEAVMSADAARAGAGDQAEGRTIAGLLRQAAVTRPAGRVAVGEDAETFASLVTRADRWSRRLLAAGARPGDKVGILLDPCLDYLGLIFGTAGIGATAVPISDRFKSAELHHVVTHADLTVLVTTDQVAEYADYVGLLRAAFPELPEQNPERLNLPGSVLRRAILLGEQSVPGFTLTGDLDPVAETIPDNQLAELRDRVHTGDAAFVVYTSGTSAKPKGCLLSHSAFIEEGAATAAGRYKLSAEDSFWCPLPLFHNGGLCTLTSCLVAGANFIHSGRFEPCRSIRQLEREGCTHAIPAFEAIWLPMLDSTEWQQADLEPLRMIVHAGTPERLRQLQRRHPQITVLSTYGSTEGAGHVAMSVPEDPIEIRSETSGFPLPGVEVRIVDPETRQPRPPGERGEIEFRGPTRFLGYYKDDEENARALDRAGWFRTGDLGVMDPDGRLSFAGRLKDMLKVGGENVSAVEVEAFLLSHPAVNVCAVVGAPDARYTEVPAAFVQLKPGAEPSEDELISFCIDRIATFKVPRYVRFVDEWPMSGTKIKKYELRAQIADELQRQGISEAPPVKGRRAAVPND